MREIIFRGKWINNREWVYGFYRHNYIYEIDEIMHQYKTPLGDEAYCWLKVIPETVGQYTGIKDKNGMRIFEGDIIYSNLWGAYMDSGNRVVEFADGRFGFYLHYQGRSIEMGGFKLTNSNKGRFEVVGNIHKETE